MLYRIVALCIVFGLVMAEPVPEISSPPAKESRFMSDLLGSESTGLARVEPTLILDLINAVIGYKSSALAIAVAIIDWLVSKSVMIIVGAIITFGFCKLTDKCNLEYEQFVPVSSLAQFKTLATPERLARAERFLVTAVEKYAEKKKGKLPLNAL